MTSRSNIQTNAGGGDDGRKKKRRKKSPGSTKDARDSSRSGGGGGGLRIIDDEADMMTLDTKKVDKAWEEEETEGVPCVWLWFAYVRAHPHALVCRRGAR